MKITKFITISAAILMSFSAFLISDNINNTQEVEATIQLKGKKWDSPTITYQINPNTEPIVQNAWTRAIQEINKYKVVNFVPSNSPQVHLGQQLAQDSTELGITQNWFKGTSYTKSQAFLSVNSAIKQRYGSNYAQRQYATALHELGHVIGLKHDSCKNGVMYYSSRSDISTIDSEFLCSMRSLYGFSHTPIENIPQAGTVRVKYVPGYGVNIWNDLGKNCNNKKIKHNSHWKYFKIQKVNNHVWFNLGGNQWVDGNYLVLQ